MPTNFLYFFLIRKCTGGLKHCVVVDRHLVSAFVPFLPLEREHVKMCIRYNADAKHRKLNDKEINAIADKLQYSPQTYNSSPLLAAGGWTKRSIYTGMVNVNVVVILNYRFQNVSLSITVLRKHSRCNMLVLQYSIATVATM